MRTFLLPAAACLLLAGCHRGRAPQNSLDAIDNQLVNGTATAASGNGLAAAIRVDPSRTGAGAANDGARSVSLGDLARRQADTRSAGARTIQSPLAGECGGTLTYSDSWAHQLPADLPLPPGAQVTEAAGHDGGCLVRVVSFTVPAGRQAVLDWYRTRLTQDGYTIGRADQGGTWILDGGRARDGATYHLMIGQPGANRTPVDLVWNR